MSGRALIDDDEFFVEFAVDEERDGRTWEAVDTFDSPSKASRVVRDLLAGQASEVRIERRTNRGDGA